ncbi:MAG: winged helix-turn-helix transcriptional regulator [Cytophagaceae bacterium]|nr:winged helix-turn-helix transcriptional regulator [Cytophagaceae bacterium]MBK9509932.1 winged helix-turn-helix transcriptional regulator [Cytophagaceae bacterium]MBK9932966.1 winged helix-turn-helix transcriptional regulator [Cytophagaceae bacterium]MBL0303321.1 winged helix-turn-helix transcriptional regulator [Cytophagaceae bacterium]MBL0326171.1 winged helix-turn-helix transcriptional regulator [Cytophagaceae bacterium]
MGVTKTDNYLPEHNDMGNLLKALAHPARVAILEYLMNINTCICGDIVKELNLAQPTVSQHLKEMKQARIIKGTVEGNAICYCLDEDTLKKLRDYFGSVLNILEGKKFDCC